MKNDQTFYMIHGTDYKEMAKQILAAANVASRIGDRAKSVALKPNLVTTTSPEDGATTHTELVCGVIEYLQEHGFEDITVMESAWVGARTMDVFTLNKLDVVLERYSVPFVDLQKDTSTTYDAAGMDIAVCDRAMDIDYMINMPVLKGHCQTMVTCALKNNKGVIPNSEKRRFHTIGLHKPIAHLNTVCRNDFILVDNICGDLSFEEGGNPVTMNRVLGFTDPVLCDAFAADTMGYAPDDIGYIKIARELGIGSTDLASANVIRLNEPDLSFRSIRKDTSSPATDGFDGGASAFASSSESVMHAVPPRPYELTARLKKLAAHVDARDACSACYGALLHALGRMDEAGTLRHLSHHLEEMEAPGTNSGDRLAAGSHKIAIGQGWRDARNASTAHSQEDDVSDIPTVGIGKCTAGLAHSCPGCPPSAQAIRTFLSNL